MRFATVALIAALVALSAAELTFEQWTTKYQMVYAPEPAPRLRAVYNNNLNLIRKLNKLNGKEEAFGANEFMLMTPDEFARTHLSRPVDAATLREAAMAHPHFVETEKIQIVKDLPDSFNWVDQGAVSSVKNQEQCGSCYGFSGIANMEGQWKLHGPTGELLSFSEQQIVDCDRECMEYMNQTVCDNGCSGGLMPNVFSYAIKNGLELDSDYPYKGKVEQCASAQHSIVAANFTHWTLVEKNEEAIRSYLYTQGPLSIAVDATYWQFYLKNIYKGLCSANKLDHGVLLVGWGIEKNDPYWIIKNSWGAGWGKEGYIWLLRGKNKCGVSDFACSALI